MDNLQRRVKQEEATDQRPKSKRCKTTATGTKNASGKRCATTNASISLPPLINQPVHLSDVRESHSFTDTAHWVIPGMLMQGGRPQDADEIGNIVKEAKCTTFVCLQAECVPETDSALLDDGGVQDWKDDPMDLPTYGEEVRALFQKEKNIDGPTFLHYGIRDMSTAKSMEGLTRVVSNLANRIRLGETIYLHCWGGKGRAGLVATCLLLELYPESLDASSALEYIGELCQLRNMDGDEDVHYASPETEEQRAQVQEYYRRVTDN
mmetsp:Transcript_27430/g.46688  ORF Transcript_27430/g.46688 Transcript_27430/m.46688 type:complete len:265 (+) Transcript_27430:202-996(+)